MPELGKPFLSKSDKKKQDQCQNAACEQKTQARNGNSVQTKKPGLERIMNELRKPLKNPIQKIEKSEKISFQKSTRFLAPLPVSA